MAEEFSAQHFKDMSPADFEKEVQRLGVTLNGKDGDDAINEVYNAELRRRGEELAKQEAEQTTVHAETPVEPAQDVIRPDAMPEIDDDPDLDGATDDDGEDENRFFNNMTIPELRVYAQDRHVELGSITKKADIIDVLVKAGV